MVKFYHNQYLGSTANFNDLCNKIFLNCHMVHKAVSLKTKINIMTISEIVLFVILWLSGVRHCMQCRAYRLKSSKIRKYCCAHIFFKSKFLLINAQVNQCKFLATRQTIG